MVRRTSGAVTAEDRGKRGQSLVDWTSVAAVDRRKEGGWMIYDSPLGEGETGRREGDRAREVKGEG